MTIVDLEFMQGFIRMACDGYTLGWHERNGGNLSYRMKPEEVDRAKENFNSRHSFQPINVTVPNLGGEFFLLTGSGKFMRNVALQPADNLCIVELDRSGENYRVVWGLEKGGVPTSELPTHFMSHSVKKMITNGEHRVIYHAHTTNLIALTFILPLDDKTFSRILWTMATECLVVFPEGVGVVQWMVPGGREIALATCELIKKYNVVVWAHHGTFCSGSDFDTTFGLMHTVEKSAEIYLKAIAAGQLRQTISSDNLRNIAKAFKVTLREEFLV